MELDSKLVVLKKCGRRRSNGVDRISELPDDILVHVLSFLPLKGAAATSAVSRRWSHLWRYIPNLIFENLDYRDPIINIEIEITIPPTLLNHSALIDLDVIRTLTNIEWVNTVLSSHNALSLKKFEISFYIHKDCHHQAQILNGWIRFALSRQVEIFVLNLHLSPLVLDTNIFFTAGLRTSVLKEVTLQCLNASGEAIELFLRICSSLERFNFYDVELTSDLVVSSCSLKYFDLFINKRREKSIKVYAPNLIQIDCYCNFEWLFLEDVPNLLEALLEPVDPQSTIDHFATAAAKLEILTICLRNRPTVFRVPEMPKLIKVFLDYRCVNQKFLLPITRLIQASPCLQEFQLRISSVGMPGIKFPRVLEVEKDHIPHKHLKVFGFEGFCWGAVDHVELLRYMVDICVGLQEIIVTPIPPIVVLPYKSDVILDESDCKDNPYLTSAGSSDPDVVESKRVEAESDIKKRTEEVVAAAAATSKHLKLRIL